MPDRRFYDRPDRRSRSPPSRGPPAHVANASDRGRRISPPALRNRRCDPVDDGDGGWYRREERYSTLRRGRDEDPRGLYRNGGRMSCGEFGRITGVDDSEWVRPVGGLLNGDYRGDFRRSPGSPFPWQRACVREENDVRAIAGVDGAGRMMPIGECFDRQHGTHVPLGRYSHSPQRRSGVQMENDMPFVSKDYGSDWRHGHRQTRRESDDEVREDWRREYNVAMTHKNERIGPNHGESASEKVQLESLPNRGRNVESWQRIIHNDCGRWSPGDSYRSSDGRGHKGKEVLNHDHGIQTSISTVTDESLRNFPGFLNGSFRDTYKHRDVDYGHPGPYGTYGRGTPLLEGMPSQMGLSTEDELPPAVLSRQTNIYSPPRPQADVKREHLSVNSRGVDSTHHYVHHEASALLPHSKSSRESEFLVHRVSYHRHDHTCSTKDLHGVRKYYMERGSKRDAYDLMSDNFYDKVRERYGLQNPSSSHAAQPHSLLNGTEETDTPENSSESRLLDRGGYDVGPSYVRVNDRLLGLRDDCLNYSKESYTPSDRLQFGTGEGYEGDFSWLGQNGLENEMLTKHDQATREGELPFCRKHIAEGIDASDQYDERSLKTWHGRNVKLGRHDIVEEFHEIPVYNEKFPSATCEDKHWTVENNHLGNHFHHSLVERMHGNRTDKRIPVHMRLDFGKQDVRKRLGPPRKTIRFSKVIDLPDDNNGTYTKMEPSEDSEEFKQLVNTHFLRFFKFLNETSAQRRKYSNQGGSSTFRCRVCGSNSKEFGDVRALVMHTFMCQVFGLRSEHLGFHKAICVLIGWDSSYIPETPWVPRQLPDGVASGLREDLVIWPPVVVIHNSTFTNTTSEERTSVSVEDLEAILGGWGYGKRKMITRGKPADNSVLLVIYKATLSDLLDAKNLAEFLAEKGRGRADLQNMVTGSRELQLTGVIAEDATNCLYGYLGSSGDLEKLDSETRKRCAIRSMKDIQNRV